MGFYCSRFYGLCQIHLGFPDAKIVNEYAWEAEVEMMRGYPTYSIESVGTNAASSWTISAVSQTSFSGVTVLTTGEDNPG